MRFCFTWCVPLPSRREKAMVAGSHDHDRVKRMERKSIVKRLQCTGHLHVDPERVLSRGDFGSTEVLSRLHYDYYTVTIGGEVELNLGSVPAALFLPRKRFHMRPEYFD